MTEDQEYQKAYDAEMDKLNGTASNETTEAKQATPPPETEPPKEELPAKVEQTEPEVPDVATLAKELEKAQQALKDTQRWGHNNAAEIKRLKQEREQEQRQANRPGVLDANPGLEEAIRYVQTPTPQASSEQTWLNTVGGAIPDIENLLQDKDFYAVVDKKRFEMGPDWNDPIAATRELGDLRAQFMRDKAVSQAIEKARKDFEVKAKKQTAMQVPGGGGSNNTTPVVDDVARIQSMSSADFQKMRAKTLGY